MAKFEVPLDTESSVDHSEATNIHTPDRVETWLRENVVEHRSPGGGHIVPSENETISEVLTQDKQECERHQDLLHLGFEKPELSWNPRVRFLFKHVEGNSAIRIKPEVTRQEISAEPTGVLRQPDEPLVVKLLGSLQSRSEVNCEFTVKSIRCKLYYSPDSDNVILYNMSSHRISATSSSGSTEVDPWKVTTLCPAHWNLSHQKDAVDLTVLPRRYFLKIEEKTSTATKRSADADLSEPASKKAKDPAGSSTRTMIPKAASRLEIPTTVWAGIDLKENQLVKVTDMVTGHVEYSMHRLTNWAHKTPSSETFKAIIEDGISRPEVVVVKIIQRPDSHKDDDGDVIRRAANAWTREFVIHQSLQHPHIAGLRGGDARTLSLFVEHKQARDLASNYWRNHSGTFRGEITDACRILAQISSALQYLKEQRIAHNDIKPGNILYTPTEWLATGAFPSTSAGAVLIDFGLATPADCVQAGGTPWYIPPEIRLGKRGVLADIFSLGVTMLYAMRRIPLPETWSKYPAWNIQQDYSKHTDTLKAIELWRKEVDRQAKALEAPSVFVRETKLYGLVRRMLLVEPEDRITPSELVEETKSWNTARVGENM